MSKIKVEHLAPYLPYKLKVRIPENNDKKCRKYVIGTVGGVYSDGSIVCHDTVNATPDRFKPILKPTHISACVVKYDRLSFYIEFHYDVFGLIDKGQAIEYDEKIHGEY